MITYYIARFFGKLSNGFLNLGHWANKVENYFYARRYR